MCSLNHYLVCTTPEDCSDILDMTVNKTDKIHALMKLVLYQGKQEIIDFYGHLVVILQSLTKCDISK